MLKRAKRKRKMGIKSRMNYPVKACVGCIDNGSRRCKDCLGRPQDKRKNLSKGFDNDAKFV